MFIFVSLLPPTDGLSLVVMTLPLILIYELIKKRKVEFVWVKGHAGIPENERCDVLSKQAAESSNQLIDEGYNPKDS